MAGIIVWAETKNGQIRKSSLEAIQAAHLVAKNDVPVSAVLIGTPDQADVLASYPLNTIYVMNSDTTGSYHSESYTDAMYDAIQTAGADTVVVAATALGRDLSARLAARMNAVLATDVIGIDTTQGLVVDRPAYSGKLITRIELLAENKVFSIRPNLFDPASTNDSKADIQTMSQSNSTIRAIVKDAIKAAQGVLDITEADIIVSGGRGVGGPEGFKLIQETAQALGGAVGASRSAVDEGWIAYSHQVGQTGKVVSPVLYIACGISGAIQHFAGMGSARYIIAINSDSEAPIMKKADFAIVGDLFKVLPALREELLKLIRK